jgi:hypothetical protein
MPVRRWCIALVACTATFSAHAQAQPADNNYAIDLWQGPILAPIRVISMGGAYAGYAEGIAGFVSNAASPAVRHSHSSGWVDQDIDVAISIPLPLFDNNDFDNSGDLDADYSNFIYLAGGLQLQLGAFGLGFFGDIQRYSLSFPPEDEATVVTLGRYNLLAGWGFLGNQLVLGGGVRSMSLGIGAPGAALTFVGFGPQMGVLIKPDWTPFRVGATYRHKVTTNFSIGTGESIDPVTGVRRAGNLVVPNSVELPWEIELGTAIQVGSRPLNPEWIDPSDHEDELRASYRARQQARARRMNRQLAGVAEGGTRKVLERRLVAEEERRREREEGALAEDLSRLRDERRARAENWPRDALLLTFDLKITGPVENAIHLERFISQGQAPPDGQESDCIAVASGEELNFSPRFGLEMEPIKGWMHTRFGSYYEPPRYRHAPESCNDRVGRQHFTFGADVKVVTTTLWGLVPEVTYKIQGYGDLAPRYQAFGLGFGVWY